jgi:hypothetical protein
MLATLLIHRLCNAEVSSSTAEYYSSKGVMSAIELSSAVNFAPFTVSLRIVAVLIVVLVAVLVVVLVAVLVVCYLLC